MSHLSTRARFVARLARARARDRPHTLSHLVTARCDARCATCLWRDPRKPDLATGDIEWLYREAGSMGLAQVVVWGGEPLLRQDLPELLLAARSSGLATTLITNGWLIGERWPELRGLVDVLILSLDDVGDAHDRLRGLPGLYERLEAFVETLHTENPDGYPEIALPESTFGRRQTRSTASGHMARPTLLVNTVLSQLNVGALERVAPVARRWGAGLYFCPMETGEMTAAGFAGRREDLALTPAELGAAAATAAALRSAGYPIMATRRYLELLARDPDVHDYACRAPRALVTVEADGAVRDCLRSGSPLTTIAGLRAAGRGLETVLTLPRRHELLAESASCTKCNNPDIVELSWLWDLRPPMLERVVRLARL